MIKLYKEYVEAKRLRNLQTKLAIFQELNQMPFLSKRFLLEQVLDLTKDQVEYNNTLWGEENGSVEVGDLLSKVGASVSDVISKNCDKFEKKLKKALDQE